MAADTAVERLADLVVDALELGTRKGERDVADDLFRAFGLDLDDLVTGSRSGPRQTERLRRLAAARLVAGVPDAAALMTEVVRCGGRFMGMVAEVYETLAEHRSTTSGPSEEFRFRRDDVRLDLPISPAFIERVRWLSRQLTTVVTGRIDEPAVQQFVGPDNGEFYGSLPEGVFDEHRHLSDSAPRLRVVAQFLDAHPDRGASWAPVPEALASAVSAADRLVDACERLVVGYANSLAATEEDELQANARDVDDNIWADRRAERVLREWRLLATDGVIGEVVDAPYYSNLDSSGTIGIRVGPRPEAVALPERDERHWGTGMSSLAMFVGVWRLGLIPARRNEEVDDLLAQASGDAAVTWLGQVRDGCRAATRWIEDVVHTPGEEVTVERVVEVVEEFLNLPLWRHRDVLYEVWVLCTTLTACRRAGWRVDLHCLEQEGDVWVLPVDPTDEAVATITYDADPAVQAEVWREPRRLTPDGLLTPDVAVSTPGPGRRDLVVVEAKDRYGMAVGAPVPRTARNKPRTALDVGRRYVEGLRAVVTWVCNHCDLRRGDARPSTNHGDHWARLHLGSAFRPGAVPWGFFDSVRVALTPPGYRIADPQPPTATTLVLVVDVTGSMHADLETAWETLAADGRWHDRFTDFRAVLYSDHGMHDPFVTHELGPCRSMAELIVAISTSPMGGGGEPGEALEDAISVCGHLVDQFGPQQFLVVTDAPPHPPEECPFGIDFDEEMDRLLASGSRCFVASDWQREGDEVTWAPFEAHPNFRRDLLSRFGDDLLR